ncbi:MAG TPA: tRNA 4-thiouridine(8) synthase ThiI [Candidatus Eubacterium faecipullorum]|uniref:Probable tRNA sulfurtransferase n=1 Tax=Candidatus Eubacterium faecipullorum TaxID=2838571 RepID=A0A9D1REN4_9FIRM|nr:tRNA 4-thiouridine(8) synthase ThiI [Candidatus Eubacterium faecipullorum]
MKEIILVKNGELVLKGLNRSSFEDILIKNMRRHLEDMGEFKFTKSQSTIMVEAPEGADLDEAAQRLGKVFGIAAYSRAAVCEKDMQKIIQTAREYLADELSLVSTFKVEAKRSDKKFPLKSPEICRELGGALLKNFHHLKVDVHQPDVTVTVEIRDNHAFVRGNNIKGAGGMPTGTSGRAAVLISGGIDSPVAAYMMAKRGIELVAVHFASPPYTSELAEMKVMDLLKKVSAYCGTITTYIVPFTEIQEAIRDDCPEEYFTLVMRRIMMRISNIIAENQNCRALITGESLGQVASQTIYALQCTDSVAKLPVFRPCIGMDKDEIIAVSRKIDTFETSIQPYEDCCTVFTPKHPRTRPKPEDVEAAEAKIHGLDQMIDAAVSGARRRFIKAAGI